MASFYTVYIKPPFKHCKLKHCKLTVMLAHAQETLKYNEPLSMNIKNVREKKCPRTLLTLKSLCFLLNDNKGQ